MVGTARGEAEQLSLLEDRRDHGDVGEVGAPSVGVVEDPEIPVAVFLVDDHGDGVGHRAEVHGDVLRLHDQLAAGIEERGGAVVALGDVG
jgi:hypothetical protein